MRKLKGLLLTEGMHSMISQVEGLAKALDVEYTHQKVELYKLFKFIPPKLTPISGLIFKSFKTQEYDLIISCGRKSVVPSIFLKKNSKKKIVNIHIQDPKVSLNNFDHIIVPEHDDLRGKNVITTKGAIHYLTIKEIQNNHSYLKDKVDKNKKYLTLILGGPNKYYDFKNTYLEEIFKKINILLEKYNLQGIIVPSMRTPQATIDLANSFFKEKNLIIENVDKKAYLSSLSLAKFVIVTCDSTSMISEAALTGKPIYIAEIPSKRDDSRFRKFRELFSKLNITRILGHSLDTWTYERLDETKKIAEIIKNKL